MPYFNRSDNLKLFYTLHGNSSDPPFLLIHGMTCDSTDWVFTIPALASKYHVITLDLRGHGHSSAPEDTCYTIPDLAADAVALLQHLNYTSDVLVMGHSLGAVLSSALTGLYPNVFRGVVIIDAPYWSSAAFWAEKLPLWDKMQNFFNFIVYTYGNQLPPDVQPWMLTWYLVRGSATPDYVVGETLKGLFEPGRLGLKEEHEKLVKGRVIPRLAVYKNEEDAELEKKLGLGELDQVLQFKDAGHWPHHSRTDEFNKVLLQWLEKIEDKHPRSP